MAVSRLRTLIFSPGVYRDTLIAIASYIFRASCGLCIPICVFYFILWCQAVQTAHLASTPVPLQDGIISAVFLALASVASYYFEALYMMSVASAGLRVRSNLASQVFSYVLSRRLGTSPALNSGMIHNLHAVDTAALEHAPDALLTLLLQPLEILGILLLLIWFVGGPAAGGAVAAVVFTLSVTVAAGLSVKELDHSRTEAANSRVRSLSEFLNGMRAVKLLGWERRFGAAITAARATESSFYSKATPYIGLVNVTSSNGIDLISLALLLVYVYGQGLLISPSMIFTFWVLLAALHGRVFHFPIALSEAREAIGAWARITAFLDSAQSSSSSSSSAASAGAEGSLCSPASAEAAAPPPSITLHNASISWAASSADPAAPAEAAPPTLLNLSLHIPSGSCTAVTGPVASGKTTLLLALLGEVRIQEPGRAQPTVLSLPNPAYVPQAPWTLPTTVRDNILLGRPFEPAWYAAVTAACCLQADFAAWQEGDLSNTSSTILSGGQRARVALARAAYGRPSLLLADDPFAALDAQVGRRVMEGLLCGQGALLRGCTRVIVTSSQGVVDRCDGVVSLAGCGAGSSSSSAVAAAGLEEVAVVEVGSEGASAAAAAAVPEKQEEEQQLLSETQSTDTAHSLGKRHAGGAEEEQRQEQQHAPLLGIAQSLFTGVGGPLLFALLLLCLLSEAAFVELSAVVLTRWSDDPTGALSSIAYYFSAYGLCLGLEFASAYARQMLHGLGTRAAADGAHSAIVARLVGARMTFFDSASTGSLIAVLGADLSEVDKGTWYATEYSLLGWVYSAVVVLTNAVFTPYSLLALLPPAVLYAHVVHPQLLWQCCCCSRSKASSSGSSSSVPGELSLREPASVLQVAVAVAEPCSAASSTTTTTAPATAPPATPQAADAKVPISDHLTHCLEGGPVLRAFPGARARFEAEHSALWQGYAAHLTGATAANVREVRFFNLLGALYYAVTVAIIIPCVLYKGSFNTLEEGSSSSSGGSSSGLVYMTPGVAGLLLLNAAFASYMLSMILQNGQALERLRAARSRLAWHAHPQGRIPSEEGSSATPAAAAASTAPLDPPPGWPHTGHLVLTQVALRYGPHLPLVLRGVSLQVQPGRKVCVVGRTGAGKSSLVAAISRLVEVEGGKGGGRVTLDGLDCATVPLAQLRRAVCVVTQDPLFFQGSLRLNLDPFGEHADSALLGALSAVGFELGAAWGLASDVGERGAGLSAGQCQLVSLARALLRQPKLLILDEATASLDRESEEGILRTLRGPAFAAVACLIIAHRLQCAVECDSVVVMEGGLVAECGSPGQLLEREGGAFAALVQAAPPALQQELRRRARVGEE